MPISIENFSIFTGKNGSGKTHILEAIKLNNIKVDDIIGNQTLHLNYVDFEYNFQKVATTERSPKLEAWNHFSNSNSGDIIYRIHDLDGQVPQNKDLYEELALRKKKPLFELKLDDFNGANAQELFDALTLYKKNVADTFDHPDYLNNEIALSVYDSVISKSKKFITSLDRKEFIDLYEKCAIGTRNILTDLSSVFLEYHKRKNKNILNQATSKAYFNDTQFVEEYGEKPWDLVREILNKFNFGFEINDPESEDVDPIDGSFSIKFINTRRQNQEVPFNDLSSGEKILITLVNAFYTCSRNGKLPKLLLLDEIDGPLNPSIIEKFVEFLNENFVRRGIKVILATHSPSTVAFASENAIYLVDTSDTVPVRNVAREDGVSKLSEGFITLETLVHLRTLKAKKIIISEGENYRYLEKAKDIFAAEKDIDVVKLGNIGSGSLRSLFEFLRVFNNDKEIYYVWDFDYRYIKEDGIDTDRDFSELKRTANNKNRFFVFEKNRNGIIMSGVENLFDQTTTEDYEGTIKDGKLSNKEHFRDYILERNVQDDFVNFAKLFQFIDSPNVSNV